MQTEAVEDYIKAIYEIQQRQGRASTTRLAERLNVAPPSVTSMVKKLASMQLVDYEPYRGVVLTQSGQRIALELIRRHRLVETYLTQELDLPWDQVHAEADRLEHVFSKDIVERIDALLGHPSADPHGAPIPTREGTISQLDRICLTDLESGRAAVVAEVSDHDPALLRYLGDLGIYPREAIAVLGVAPVDEPLQVRVAGATQVLGREAAEHVMVTVEKDVE